MIRSTGVLAVMALVAGCGSGNTPGEAVSAVASADQNSTVQSGAAKSDPGADLGATALGGVGDSNAKVVLDIYEDFMCPACAQFEKVYGDQIAKAIGDGKLRVRYHMLDFLDRNSASKDYSSRAAGAAKAVFDKAPDKFLEFHKKLFEDGTQPQEGAETDLSNDQLAQLAEQVGAGAAAADIRSGADVQAASGSARASVLQLSKITGNVATPTVLKDAKPVRWQDPQWLAALL